ncbi:MCE family protein [Bailinhaonella thermotolerans]|uniref:MCE family protein n=1 Tax=Bailinhaonella thermotolerans TaxID=1070861 RepID=A0A3A4B7V3_9ACTN|nr:MCE family protein [Bailinhaonella thermotolerans]RJL34311.1 MCE family protein [Bailinhaonella thermotolerans]
MRRLIAALAAATVVLTGCGGGGETGGFRLTAYFAKATALYEQSRVKIMGIDVGTIERIRVEGNRVRVEMSVDGGVPVPADVRASIVSLNTLGERNIILHPAWKPGMERIRPGAVIPQERTELPVEIDDALKAFTKLSDSLDPKQVSGFIEGVAKRVDGRGDEFNRALQGTAQLTHNLASQDQRLIKLAEGLNKLAKRTNARERKLGSMLDSFAGATGQLVEERREVQRFATSLASFVRKGHVIVEKYSEKLPQQLASLSELILTLRANSASVAQTVAELAKLGDVVLDAWDKEHHVLKIRLALSPTLKIWLQPLFDALGLGEVPCPPAPLGNCPGGKKKGGGR